MGNKALLDDLLLLAFYIYTGKKAYDWLKEKGHLSFLEGKPEFLPKGQ
ncbi:MAG: hypothetical protein HOK67_06055 [Deltaproteobacteria bacterium]|nr:hypothetical protein [Deltaproteobacteria bacterium]